MSFSLCTANNPNVGAVKCDVSRGVLRQLMIFNDDISSADYSTPGAFLAFLIAGSKLSRNAVGKVFPLPTVEDIQDKADANKEGSLNLGYKTVLIEGKPNYTIKFFGGDMLLKALRKFNNKTIGVLEYDANGNVWGALSGGKFVGFDARIFVTGGKIATGQNVEEQVIEVTVSILDASQYKDASAFQSVESTANIKGLIDANMYEIGNHVSNVHKIAVKIPTSQAGGFLNVYSKFADALADSSLFTAKVGANFATTLAITTVAKSATDEGWAFTFDTTDYAALSTDAKILLSAVAPPDLDTADVTELEINPITLTK